MVKSLMAFAWLRDLTIVLLLLAGNHVRQSAPATGLVIMSGAVVVFVERFLWSWYVSGLNAEKSEN